MRRTGTNWFLNIMVGCAGALMLALVLFLVAALVHNYKSFRTVPTYTSGRFKIHTTIMRRHRVGKGWLVMAESGSWCVYIPPQTAKWSPVTVPPPLDTKVEKDK